MFSASDGCRPVATGALEAVRDLHLGPAVRVALESRRMQPCVALGMYERGVGGWGSVKQFQHGGGATMQGMQGPHLLRWSPVQVVQSTLSSST